MHAQYLNIVSAIPGIITELYLHPSIEDINNTPWAGYAGLITRHWQPEKADILFLEGRDWEDLPPEQAIEERVKVVNLIQGVRHADPDNFRYAFLNRKALRICVSPEIEQALRQTGRCNGPIITIPNAVSVPFLSLNTEARTTDIAIAAVKQPTIAQQLATALQANTLQTDYIEPVDRISFLTRLGRSRIAIVLPGEREGFYLPALEAMALGCLVICPNCIGNRSFCLDGETCLMPHEYTVEALYACVMQALAMPQQRREQIIVSGLAMAAKHNNDRLRDQICNAFNHEFLN